MEKFDYKEAVRELESIAAKVEDPSTGLDDIDKYVKRSKELIICALYVTRLTNWTPSEDGGCKTYKFYGKKHVHI